MEEKGRVFDIQRFSVHDGPGIRTTVFLKGCPLHCRWCHNPEGISPNIQVMLDMDKCTGCGKCISVCEMKVHDVVKDGLRIFRAEKCIGCGRCASVCSSTALKIVGKSMSVDEVFDVVLRDKPFYCDDGGVSFSGGEVMLQPRFLLALLKRALEEGLNTAVDTSGYCRWLDLKATLPYTDLYLYDVKAFTSQLHYQLTGQDNWKIKANLSALSAAGARIWIRMPLISGVNDDIKEISATAEFLKDLRGVERLDLLPYHVLGRAKYGMLGQAPQEKFYAPTRQRMDEYAELFRSYSINVTV